MLRIFYRHAWDGTKEYDIPFKQMGLTIQWHNLYTNVTDLTTKIQALTATTICILHPIPYPHLPDWALSWVYLTEYNHSTGLSYDFQQWIFLRAAVKFPCNK